LPLARRLVNGRERGCLQVVPCIVLRLVNMSTRAMRLKTQARVLACLQVVYPNLSVVKEQSLSASLVRLEKELFPLYLGHRFATRLRLGGYPRALPRFSATMTSSDFCNAFAPQTSQVPGVTFQTCSASLPLRLGSLEPRAPLARRLCPSMPRHAFHAANRLRRFFSASRALTRWPHGMLELTGLNSKGSRTLLQLCFAKLLATLVGEPDALRRRCIALRLIRL